MVSGTGVLLSRVDAGIPSELRWHGRVKIAMAGGGRTDAGTGFYLFGKSVRFRPRRLVDKVCVDIVRHYHARIPDHSRATGLPIPQTSLAKTFGFKYPKETGSESLIAEIATCGDQVGTGVSRQVMATHGLLGRLPSD